MNPTMPFSPASLKLRYLPLALAWLGMAGFAALLWLDPHQLGYLVPLAACSGLALVGLSDLFQRKHAILRNYPIAAHLRFLLEKIRPEMRQYFFEDDKEGLPFPRDKRAIVYQRAKGVLDKRPFGTQYDIYASRYEWMHHSIAPKPAAGEPFRIAIGGPDSRQPYSASVFNISAMSFGSLSANAVRALNRGAKMGNFAHDTGEGGLSPYHREHGGDMIWEIGSGYFGCRNQDRRRPIALSPSPTSTASWSRASCWRARITRASRRLGNWRAPIASNQPVRCRGARSRPWRRSRRLNQPPPYQWPECHGARSSPQPSWKIRTRLLADGEPSQGANFLGLHGEN
jgi:hypothetical protein